MQCIKMLDQANQRTPVDGICLVMTSRCKGGSAGHTVQEPTLVYHSNQQNLSFIAHHLKSLQRSASAAGKFGVMACFINNNSTAISADNLGFIYGDFNSTSHAPETSPHNLKCTYRDDHHPIPSASPRRPYADHGVSRLILTYARQP